MRERFLRLIRSDEIWIQPLLSGLFSIETGSGCLEGSPKTNLNRPLGGTDFDGRGVGGPGVFDKLSGAVFVWTPVLFGVPPLSWLDFDVSLALAGVALRPPR